MKKIAASKSLPSVAKMIEENQLFRGLSKAEIKTIEKLSHRNGVKSGELLVKAGQIANNFYLLESCRLAIEIHTPHGAVVLQTLSPGDIVGWSWLFEPHKWVFDVRVIESGFVIEIDGEHLRNMCEKDPKMGFDFIKRFAKLLAKRLEVTRHRLLDVYGVKS